MDISSLVKPELLILIPVLYIVGLALKKTAISDKLIPLILGAAGVVLSAVHLFASCEVTDGSCALSVIFASFTQGVLCAGASVYANQIYKQLFNKGEK